MTPLLINYIFNVASCAFMIGAFSGKRLTIIKVKKCMQLSLCGITYVEIQARIADIVVSLVVIATFGKYSSQTILRHSPLCI